VNINLFCLDVQNVVVYFVSSSNYLPSNFPWALLYLGHRGAEKCVSLKYPLDVLAGHATIDRPNHQYLPSFILEKRENISLSYFQH